MTGNELKAKRKQMGMTQEELARELGVVGSSVARWEQLRGHEIPNALLPLAIKGIEAKKEGLKK